MAEVQPELWVADVSAAIDFYREAFGAQVEMHVGEPGDAEGVAQLSIGEARLWVSNTSTELGRLDAAALGGATGRTLLVVEDPDAVLSAAVAAGARLTGPAADEHGWRLGRCVDPFGHEWEIGRPER